MLYNELLTEMIVVWPLKTAHILNQEYDRYR
jgi:hypothetical protein